jgi:hypothetical protein
VGDKRRVESRYHAFVTLSSTDSRANTGTDLSCAEEATAIDMAWWSGWALTRDPRRAAASQQKPSHQTSHSDARTASPPTDTMCPGHLGASPPAREDVHAKLSGRAPLSSQYASGMPIGSLLNASRLTCLLPVLAVPDCSAHSPRCVFGKEVFSE